jgi:hypothetical protein
MKGHMNKQIKLEKWIIDILTNDEVSTDDELINHFINEGGLTKKQAVKWVLLRDSYRLENLI